MRMSSIRAYQELSGSMDQDIRKVAQGLGQLRIQLVHVRTIEYLKLMLYTGSTQRPRECLCYQLLP
jgi:hypothetical protein